MGSPFAMRGLMHLTSAMALVSLVTLVAGADAIKRVAELETMNAELEAKVATLKANAAKDRDVMVAFRNERDELRNKIAKKDTESKACRGQLAQELGENSGSRNSTVSGIMSILADRAVDS